MRKLSAALTVLGMAALGTVVPVSAAHAAETCSDNYSAATAGYMYAYDYVDCVGQLGKVSGNDSDWGVDSNKASSILNKGNFQEVQFFNGTGTGWTGGHTCLSRNEGYASDLTDNYFTSGYSANNSISSHRWVNASTCDRWAT
ncbi:hypothetical protein [Streptomyces sp. NBC_00658]|uniref:hypothetical protein n=1 Tax=Streptomyces sp. NBC_00658 TaxID=2975800 RepID=UPI0032535692